MDTIVAQNIAQQLGGTGRISAMIGGHTFTAGAYNLTFKFKSRAKNGANCCRVTLGASDTYRVEFISIRGVSVRSKGDFSDVYAEDLKKLFERETGLYLSF